MSILSRRKAVWLIMHDSTDGDSETLAVRFYLDESGGNDPSITHVSVGGLIINYSHYLPFEEEWDAMLSDFGIAPPLHMREFGKGRRLSGMDAQCRFELFSAAASILGDHKIASIASTMAMADFEREISADAREMVSCYTYCYLHALMCNHDLAQNNGYGERIAFFFDRGNPYIGHIQHAHDIALEMQSAGTFLHVGTLTTADDMNYGVLQAADIIAWGCRRMVSGKGLLPGMEPINRILSEQGGHHTCKMKPEWLAEIIASARRVAERNAEDAKEEH